MRILNSGTKLVRSLYRSLNRFPIPIILCIIASIIVITMISIGDQGDQTIIDELTRITLVVMLGVPLSLCLKLIFERVDHTPARIRMISYLVGALLLILYYFFWMTSIELVTVSRYVSLSIALYLLFLAIPFIWKKEHFESYLLVLFTRFLVTIMYAAVLFIGIAIILFTIEQLLRVPISNKAYVYVFTILAGVFSPGFFLAGVPSLPFQNTNDDYPKLFQLLFLHIVIPLVTVYTAILYIYFLKIIITTVWPEGLVGHLVLWYSIVSIGVILAITPLRQNHKVADLFITWFPRAILPILIMMFISIGIRIQAYGFTENRYYVVAIGIWVFATMAYLTIMRKPRNVLILTALTCIAIIAVIGPWSAFSISKASQNERFENLLLKYDMIENGQIVKSSERVSDQDQKQISNILNYFEQSHDFAAVPLLPPAFQTADMVDVFGFAYNPYYSTPTLDKHFYYYTQVIDQPLSIQGYDYFIDMRSNQQARTIKQDGFTITYNNETNQARLQIEKDGELIYDKSLATWIQNIYDNHGGDYNKQALDVEDATRSEQNDKVDLLLILNNTDGIYEEMHDQISVQYLDFYLLLRFK